MFKVEMIRFYKGVDYQEYRFSLHSFVYGKNTRGKTALTYAIDYVLGSSDQLTYQGLDNIDSIEALLKNGKTSLWIRRTVNQKEFYYRRTEGSEYVATSFQTYKDNIGLILAEKRNDKYIQIYSRVFNEGPSYRSFNFLNYIEEKGLGDLLVVFTKAKDLKYSIRMRDIMTFFFNFENIEKLCEKEILLESQNKELKNLTSLYQEYNSSRLQQINLFKELRLDYTGNYKKDYKSFCDFKNSYVRKIKEQSKDLVYLTKASFSLAEEIKLYNYMENQTKNMSERKERVKRLLSILNDVVNEVPEYEEYTRFIKETIERLDKENVILSLTDYGKAIKQIENEKNKLDAQIEVLKASATELSYEDAMKKVGILEHTFDVLKKEVDVEKYNVISEEIRKLKEEIKELKLAFDVGRIKKFNKRLTEAYLKKELDIQHVQDDLKETDFSLEFDPFRLLLSAKHREKEQIVSFMPGSMARQTHIQLLTYLAMFEYLKENFSGFPYMPLLIIDSANQPMGVDSFEKMYPVFIDMAEKIGIQTIFMSKDKINCVAKEDFIDISNGLNKFHKS
ncbi:MAG: hypothetical protein LUD07_01835 [Clostridiales bacterium]|nr:hypothetical protein [Clostridiales bacterium]